MDQPATSAPPVLWQPTPEWIRHSNLTKYINWLAENKNLHFADYDALWRWSIRDTKAFWQTIWEYFEVISHTPHEYVHSDDPMPDTKWFAGSTLNYAEHIFRQADPGRPAIIYQAERQNMQEMSWRELEAQVAALAAWLRKSGVQKGDRVTAFIPNVPEATVAFLAACSIGAIWSSCSPDFGANSVADRFRQIEPKILFVVDGYQYNGKGYDKRAVVREIVEQLPTLEHIVILPFLDAGVDLFLEKAVYWQDTQTERDAVLTFEPVPFEHPIWVLYSSGTTGVPKAITHSHGGVLLEHLKYLAFHNDVHPGERFFWFSTTGWMMWNFVQASLLVGATIVLYDGSPGYPDLNVLWRLAEEAGIQHFGTSAPFIVACMKSDLHPATAFNLDRLRSISSTGAPLPPEGFDWVYEKVKPDVWLASMSGGTDVCTAFVGGMPTEPVYEGEIQRRGLGCAMYAFDEAGEPLVDEVGEMVITQPMPSMPIYFWNDPGKERYLESYFEMYPGIWRHGDWLKITSRNTLVILGRSDATLNRHGVRIGTAEIYSAVNKVKAVKDSLIVNLELSGGRHYMPLFVVMNEGEALTEEVVQQIKKVLRTEYSPRHVPDEIVPVEDIPYTISGKKLEAPVKKILLGVPVEKAANKGAMRNPDSLDFFVGFRERVQNS